MTQALASRLLLLSTRALYGATTSPAAAAAVGGRCGKGNHRRGLLLPDVRDGGGGRGAGQGASPRGSSAAERRAVPVPLYQAFPFCNKVRAFLDYHDVPYKVVEVNPLSKKEIKWSDYTKVPILTVDGENLIDSSDIINKLQRKISPDDESTNEEETKCWVDEHLVHILSPNICRSTSEAL